MNEPNTQKILLGKAILQRCDSLRRILSQHGIEIVTIHNKSTCSSGCSTELEIWAHPEDAGQISTIVHESHLNDLRELGYNAELLSAVYDETASHATCPACATVFSTKFTECPDCGLSMGGGDQNRVKCSTGKC